MFSKWRISFSCYKLIVSSCTSIIKGQVAPQISKPCTLEPSSLLEITGPKLVCLDHPHLFGSIIKTIGFCEQHCHLVKMAPIVFSKDSPYRGIVKNRPKRNNIRKGQAYVFATCLARLPCITYYITWPLVSVKGRILLCVSIHLALRQCNGWLTTSSRQYQTLLPSPETQEFSWLIVRTNSLTGYLTWSSNSLQLLFIVGK